MRLALAVFALGWGLGAWAGELPRAEPAEIVVAEDADGVRVTAAMLRYELALMPPEEQERARHDPALVEEVVRKIFNREKVVKAAERDKVEEDALIQYRLRLARGRELVKVMRERVEARPLPDLEPAAREYWRVHPEEFAGKEKVRASHIILLAKSEEEKKARRGEMERILGELKAGGDFAELAKKYSEDGSKRRGGDLGWFPRGKMAKPFEAAAFAMTTPGETSGIVETQFGLHIIRFGERAPPKPATFDEVKGGLIEKLAKEYRSREVTEWLKEVTKPVDLKVNRELLQEFAPEAAAPGGGDSQPPPPAELPVDAEQEQPGKQSVN